MWYVFCVDNLSEAEMIDILLIEDDPDIADNWNDCQKQLESDR